MAGLYPVRMGKKRHSKYGCRGIVRVSAAGEEGVRANGDIPRTGGGKAGQRTAGGGGVYIIVRSQLEKTEK